jgi:hypothetical protein
LLRAFKLLQQILSPKGVMATSDGIFQGVRNHFRANLSYPDFAAQPLSIYQRRTCTCSLDSTWGPMGLIYLAYLSHITKNAGTIIYGYVQRTSAWGCLFLWSLLFSLLSHPNDNDDNDNMYATRYNYFLALFVALGKKSSEPLIARLF